MINEFKEFIARGNFIDLAVGFVMGVAVSGVVNAIVERLIMPAIAFVFGQPNFDAIGTFGDQGSIGAVITAFVNFLLIAVALFFIVKVYNRFQRTKPEGDEEDPQEVVLLREIRDALAAGATLIPPPSAPVFDDPSDPQR